jgi:hypothetical protein
VWDQLGNILEIDQSFKFSLVLMCYIDYIVSANNLINFIKFLFYLVRLSQQYFKLNRSKDTILQLYLYFVELMRKIVKDTVSCRLYWSLSVRWTSRQLHPDGWYPWLVNLTHQSDSQMGHRLFYDFRDLSQPFQ